MGIPIRARHIAALFLVGVCFLIPAGPARADFGFESFSSTFLGADGDAPSALPAGSYPLAWTTTLAFNTIGSPGEEHPDGAPRDLRFELPPGLVGAPALLPQCRRGDFLAKACPASTQVGTMTFFTTSDPTATPNPVYLLEPLPGLAAQLGVWAGQLLPVTIDLSIGEAGADSLVAEITGASQAERLFGAVLTLEGTPGGAPFLTLPRSCAAPLTTRLSAVPWGDPGGWVSIPAPEPQEVSGCDSLAYGPELRVTPTTTAAAAPSGIGVELRIADPGIGSADGRAAADTSSARLVLPPGMTLNPSVATGLVGCGPAQLESERADEDPATGCPEAARLGSAGVETPLFDRPIAGDVYVAVPDDPSTVAPGAENPFDSRLALYLIFREPERGVLLALPIRIDADPETGRLSAGLPDLPQLPIARLDLRFNSGPRAPLTTPSACGRHAFAYALSPSSGNPPLEGADDFDITHACGAAFAPELSVGTTSNAAGSAAGLVLELRNAAAAPNLEGLHVTLPPGVAADLRRVAVCPEAGRAQAECPAASRVGFARVALGSGSQPLWVPGGATPGSDVYVAGPYRGAPFSLLISIPAAAGPLNLGRVLLRAPVRIDPFTAQASVEVSDLPQIRAGIPLHYRAIRIVLDRPGFIRNPTSCKPMRVESVATGANGEIATDAARFQAADCGSLGFRPRLAIRYSGGLGRNGHPRLEARFSARKGQANVEAATVDLPAGELLDTNRIRALCPPNLPPGRCPEGSRLGRAVLHSPLLPEPLRGPIFLRVSSGRYPGLVGALSSGVFQVIVHGRAGSAPRGRLRVRLERLPDMPLSRVAVTFFGGRRGIVVNSASLCSRRPRGAALLEGHNGRKLRLRPLVRLNGSC